MMHYDGNEVAMRLLPAVAPLTVDADPDVRTVALDTMDMCMVRDEDRMLFRAFRQKHSVHSCCTCLGSDV
jgi:hypothetical protein